MKHGVCKTQQEVCDHVHGCTPDEGANMLSAWRIFEGAGCVCHRAQNCLKASIEVNDHAKAVFDEVRGIAAHFQGPTRY